MIKIDKQDLIDIIDKKDTGLRNRYDVTNMSYIFSIKLL